MKTDYIYLDHAAATPMDEKVLKVMLPYFTENFFNPSSPYQPAVDVRREYEDAKHRIAKSIGAKPSEIIITAGATESVNLAMNSVRGHVVVPNIEHHSVLASAQKYNNNVIAADHRGFISPESVKNAITEKTELVSVALSNNELGTIQPIRDIAEVIKNERNERLSRGDKTPIYLHSDASQGAGLIDMNVARLGVDMLTLNAGKVYGPKQMGLLWVSSHVRLQPQIIGGGQEHGMRSGTENVSYVIGFAKALELAVDHRNYESKRLTVLRDQLQKTLLEAFPNAVVSGHQKHRLASHLHISFPNLDGERLIFLLENRGVLVATGSACAANKGTRSHVLIAIGLPDEVADGSLRLTLGHLSNEENTKLAGEIMIEEIIKEYERTRR